ncbi:hypothetical protein HQ590_16240, partial [bacterium]|nr:hypothetical protein [bacterium]
MNKHSVSLPILVNSSLADSLPVSYARVSLPFPKGQFQRTPEVVIRDPRGKSVPSQAELLARWPDGSARVLHVTFPARAGLYQAAVGPTATRASAGQRRSAIRVTRSGKDRVIVTNGRLVAKLGGAGLVQSITLGGKPMIGPAGIEVRVVDGQQRAFTATVCRTVTTEVELAGPLRTIVTLRGKSTLGKEQFLDFRLRFEFLAGVEGFSLAYAFHNRERGRDFFDVHGIELELHLADAPQPQHTVYQQSYGLFSTLGRVVATPEPIDIRVDDSKALAYVHNYAALGDDHQYPFYLNPPCDKVDNWAAVADGDRSVQVDLDDFHLLRPKSLNLDGNTARFGIWPGWAGPLALQQGKSRQVTVRVALSDRGAPATQSAGVIASAQLRDLWRAQLPQAAYGDAQFFDQGRVLPYQPHQNPRFETWLSTMSASLHSVATFFDLGDTPDSGYQSTYLPIGGRIRHVRGPELGPRYYSSSLHFPMTKQNTMTGFEPVWV